MATGSEGLTPNATLYGRKSLLELSDPTQPRDRACVEAFERELDMPWALYHVRRLFLVTEDGRRRPVKRSTERVDLGGLHHLAQRLISVSGRHGLDVEHDPAYGRARAWIRPRAKGWPMAEELFAPARVIDKRDQNFEQHWTPSSRAPPPTPSRLHRPSPPLPEGHPMRAEALSPCSSPASPQFCTWPRRPELTYGPSCRPACWPA
jgi:hypothetical protein